MAEHICSRRIVRNGRLAAFEGMRLSEEEARSLGLAPNPKPKAAPRKRTGARRSSARKGEAR